MMLQASEEPYRTGIENEHMNGPGAHTETRDPELKACSKCKMAKPLVEYFKDKSKPDSLYSQVSLRLPRALLDCAKGSLTTYARSAVPAILSIRPNIASRTQHHDEETPQGALNCHAWLRPVTAM